MTQEELRDIFEYNNGNLIWKKISKFRKMFLGKAAGTKDSNGYIKTRINGKTYSVHRLVWIYHNGKVVHQIDHINHDRSDNRIENLRDVPLSVNAKNKSNYKENGIKGIYIFKCTRCVGCKSDGNYRVDIQAGSQRKSKLVGKNLSKAIEVRDKMYKELGFHENHYRLNPQQAGENR